MEENFCVVEVNQSKTRGSLPIINGYSYIKTDTTENAEGIPWKSYGFWTKMGYKDTGERLPTKWSFKTIPFVKNLT